MAQPASNAAVAAPANAASKMKKVAPTRQGNVSADPVAGSNSTPAAHHKLIAPIRTMQTASPKPQPNLIVSVKYERDVCPADESRERKNTYNARCNLIVTVKNVGNAPTDSENGSISIVLMYYNYRNSIQKGVLHINNLRRNQTKTIVYDRFKLRNFRRSTTITVVVDRQKLITETNENDNVAVFDLM